MTVAQTDLPRELPGVIWQPLSADHAPALTMLLTSVEESEGVPYRTSVSEVEAIFKRDANWAGVAGFDASDPAQMIAFSYVSLPPEDPGVALCQGAVHPAMRSVGIGSEILRWQTEAGTVLVTSSSGHEHGRLTQTIHEKNAEFLGILDTLGYSWQNSAVELRIPLIRWKPDAGLPALLEVLPWSEDWDDPARRAFNKANSELSGRAATGKSEWKRLNADMQRNWSFVAVNREGDRPRVVGFVSAAGYQQDWEALGWREGALQIVAGFDLDRRPEIISALLDRSFAAMAADGMEKVSVTLDPDEDPMALKFYRAHGFEVSSWYHTYCLQLG